ncbi:helix-turn-helix domain-containing protein [Glaciimonas soli]|uniref:Helix-turn-helix domain-containing protein n=1 Tax=Glaciimonas soli TaxID=2590999 RepID=A0A843YSU3_9BURK|nr:helix-turn-helix domain-containing protein [Glaciimonas soli]MQR00322.1 helix-turn-helix domain-containing protein [Glaciimonas soli]
MLIQKLRLQRGWSQQQLAELSDLSVRTIQRIEQGQGASMESLRSLASVFEVDFSTLYSESEPTMNSNLNQGLTAEETLALDHVRQLKKFYRSILLYVVIISFLAVVNYMSSPHQLWVIWPALGWGLGLLLRAASLFDFFPFFGADWEKKQVEKRLGRKL